MRTPDGHPVQAAGLPAQLGLTLRLMGPRAPMRLMVLLGTYKPLWRTRTPGAWTLAGSFSCHQRAPSVPFRADEAGHVRHSEDPTDLAHPGQTRRSDQRHSPKHR